MPAILEKPLIVAVMVVMAAAGPAGQVSAEEPGNGPPDAIGTPSSGPAEDAGTQDAASPETVAEEERLADIVGADEEGESGEYGQQEDDDFVPSQEVSSDQSVNFPVDI